MSDNNQLANVPATPGFHRATSALSDALGIEPRMMVESLKKQCFLSMNSDSISDAQLAAFISVANTLKVNPLIPGMLYGYPAKNGGIIPLSGPDAILKKLDEQIDEGKLDGYECTVFPESALEKPTHAVAQIWRKNNLRAATFTAVFSEWVVSSNPNWSVKPRHMIWLRALKQCARQVIHGVPLDRDDIEVQELQNVTPVAETAPADQVQRSTPPQRTKKEKGANTVPDAKPAAIEAETVPPAPEAKVESKPVAKADPVEIAKSTTVYAEKETPAPAPAPDPAPSNVPTARAFLKDGEAVQVKCTVKEITTLMVNFKGTPTPSVSLTLGGEYIGPALHIGGASGTPDKLTPNAPWAPGATVLVSLRGKANPASGGKVLVRVDEVKAIEASPANPAMDVE